MGCWVTNYLGSYIIWYIVGQCNNQHTQRTSLKNQIILTTNLQYVIKRWVKECDLIYLIPNRLLLLLVISLSVLLINRAIFLDQGRTKWRNFLVFDYVCISCLCNKFKENALVFESNKKREGIKPAWPYEMHQMSDFVRPLFCVRAASFEGPIRDIHIECSKQFKWYLSFYVSGQSWPFWAVLKLL